MVSFKSYPWEGKGFVYYWKDTLKNRSIMLLGLPVFLIVVPISYYYLKHQDETTFLELSRFRHKYIVFRDDDPKVRNIMKLDDKGNRIYLEPRTN